MTTNTSEHKKAILAVWGTANTGKSETLRALARLLLHTYGNRGFVFPEQHPFVPDTGDFRLVIEVDGLIVAIESQGDPKSGLPEKLDDLVNNHHADVIFCATRTYGETADAVNLISERGFERIWTTTYLTQRGPHQGVNALKARHILELMRSLTLLP